MTDRKKRNRWESSLRVGSWVVVRSKEQIVATLDENATIDELPFQSEMFEFCGRRMRIAAVAHKTCDNIEKTGGRKMENAFHLEGGRCDGSKHGNCQADCVFFWKVDWLESEEEAEQANMDAQSGVCTVETVYQKAKSADGDEHTDNPTWVCQTTKLYEATSSLKWWDARQYVKDVTTGNHTVWHMTKILTAAVYRSIVSLGIGYRILIRLYNSFQKVTGGKPYPAIEGRIKKGEQTPTEITNLEIGEWVEIKSGEEIAETLTARGFNRGMQYDIEMLKYSGGRYRVEKRVDQLINEVTGKMMQMKNPCIQLEDVYCRAECTPLRLGCPRASNTYWREIWLRRIDGPAAESGDS